MEDRLQPQGTRLHWLWLRRDSWFFRHESVFVSSDLREAYGTVAVHFREDLSPVQVPLGSIGTSEEADTKPRAYRVDPESLDIDTDGFDRVLNELQVAEESTGFDIDTQQQYEEFLPQTLRQDLQANLVANLFVIEFEMESKTETLTTQLNDERETRNQSGALSNNSGSPEYSGPVAVYALDRNPANTRLLLERRAPINVVWKRDSHSDAVRRSMTLRKNGWTGTDLPLLASLPQANRHVILTTGGTSSAARVSGFDDSSSRVIDLPVQWHCRLFDVPDSMDRHHEAAGGAHRDPPDHGLLRSLIPNTRPLWRLLFEPIRRGMRRVLRASGIGWSSVKQLRKYDPVSPDWEFDAARNEVCESWLSGSTTTYPVSYPDDFEWEFNGPLGVIN